MIITWGANVVCVFDKLIVYCIINTSFFAVSHHLLVQNIMSDWNNGHALNHRLFKIIWSWHSSGDFIDRLWQQSREFIPGNLWWTNEEEKEARSRKSVRAKSMVNSHYILFILKTFGNYGLKNVLKWKRVTLLHEKVLRRSLWGKVLLHIWLIGWFIAWLVSSYLVLYLFSLLVC
jgi:hypothetical protein